MILPAKLYITRKNDPDYTELNDISEIFKNLIVRTEDASFWTHDGFCYVMIYKTLKSNIKNRSFKAGASTISQQLSKNLYFSFERKLSRKISEALTTIILEKTLSKEQILEFYLNMIYYGNNQYGIKNACKFYFNCGPSELNLEQSIHLVTIIPGPTYLNPLTHPEHVIKRREFVLNYLTEAKIIDKQYADYIRTRYTEHSLCQLFDIQGEVVNDEIVPMINPLAKDLRVRARNDSKKTARQKNIFSKHNAIQTLYSEVEKINLKPGWKYYDFSEINSGTALKFIASSNRKNITIGVNAGHGTINGGNFQTWCHPDKSPKITDGTTLKGEFKSIAVSSGMDFNDGTAESVVTLKEAEFLKIELLKRGYDVLMIRNSNYVQLDNVARTVICNNNADCHVSIHWDNDGLSYDKGCYYNSAPEELKYLETVSATWKESEKLGECLISGLKNYNNKIYDEKGKIDMDLTQTSFSTIPNACMELGNSASDISDKKLLKLAHGMAWGVDEYFGFH